MGGIKERPILFSGPMVRALLDGQKTQTRRIIKPHPPTERDFCGALFGLDREFADGVKVYSLNDYDRLPKHPTDWRLGGSVGVARDGGFPMRYRCPYGAPGDRLWVKETWGLNDTVYGGDHPIPKSRPADLPTDGLVFFATEDDTEIRNELRWRPSIHMPRWASRLTLEITDVRVERLQDISEADAIAEGLYRSTPDEADRDWFSQSKEEDFGRPPTEDEWKDFNAGVWMIPGVPQGWGLRKADRQQDTWGPTPEFCYRLLWEHINGAGSWDANPWVWAVSFRVLDRAKASPTPRGEG